jgi:xylulokinase
MATYEAAAASLLDALATIDRFSSGVDPNAPLVLIGGGAKGRTWQEVVRRLSGRAISIPEATELVAMGGAVQAAAVLLGQAPQDVAARWQSGRGALLPAMERDTATIELHREVRRLAIPALADPRGQA